MKRRLGFGWLLALAAHGLLAFQSLPQASSAIHRAGLSAPTSTTSYEPFFSEGMGYWERGSLVYVAPRDTRVDLYDKDTMRSSVRVSIPRARDLSVSDATVTEDGRLIVSGCYLPYSGRIHCFIGVAHSDGSLSPTVDTGLFSPRQISTCDGTSVWAMGWLRSGPDLDWAPPPDDPYHVLREYQLSDGKMVDSVLERTSLPFGGMPVISWRGQEQYLSCREQVLGMYEGASNEWIEYNLDSRKLSRWELPEIDGIFGAMHATGVWTRPYKRTRVTGVALLSSGEVYASFRQVFKENQPQGVRVGLFRLQKAGNRGEWIAIPDTVRLYDEPEALDHLTGTDGANLVFTRFGEREWFFSAPGK